MQQENLIPPHAHTPPGHYDLYPTFPLPDGRILTGYASIARIIDSIAQVDVNCIALDGYGGNLWTELQTGLAHALAQTGREIRWIDTAQYFLPETNIMQLIERCLGGDDPLFGCLCEAELAQFFDLEALKAAVAAPFDGLTMIFGVGAALVETADVLMYVDVPKDTIQQRMKAKTVVNLGAHSTESNTAMYKRFYFVDWPVLNRHKARVLPRIIWFIDGQDINQPSIIAGDHLRAALSTMAANCFRPRPWFAPGPWGGQYMKTHFDGLPQDVPNYAWSFELIAPENGLVLESGGERLECSFDLIMFQNHRQVLGNAAERFGYDFPIRFDYLDTFDGGNLSIQVHPRPEYIQREFGEPFTQDESYYITTCKPGAQVYLGFRDGVDPAEFRAEVERSQREGVKIDVDHFVNRVEAHPHDLFLIPNGTIHGSGVDNLVLEISATPYIYTFKIYDWMRLDLEGKPRPLNIERAFHNLYFERQETYVRENLCPRPTVIREGEGWREVFVGTHDTLFYAVHRYEFSAPLEASTENRCHLLNVVEGEAVIVETENGHSARFNYAETFVVPAAAGTYRLIPVGANPVKVVFAFVK